MESDNIGWRDIDPLRYSVLSSVFILSLDTFFHPLDVLKTLQQHNTSKDPNKSSLRAITTKLYQTQGVRGFYRGYFASILGNWPGQILYFFTYEITKDTLSQNVASHQQPGPMTDVAINLAAGASADIASLLVHTPAELISQRVMVSGRFVDVVRNTYLHEGFRGFFRGFYGAILTYTPHSAIWFAAYEACKRQLHQPTSPFASVIDPNSNTKIHLVSGLLAGTMAATLTNPMDVAKTRLQTMDINGIHGDIARRGFFHVLLWTTQQEGWRGLLRGIAPRVCVQAPASAITFAGYEFAKKLSRKPREE